MEPISEPKPIVSSHATGDVATTGNVLRTAYAVAFVASFPLLSPSPLRGVRLAANSVRSGSDKAQVTVDSASYKSPRRPTLVPHPSTHPPQRLCLKPTCNHVLVFPPYCLVCSRRDRSVGQRCPRPLPQGLRYGPFTNFMIFYHNSLFFIRPADRRRREQPQVDDHPRQYRR